MDEKELGSAAEAQESGAPAAASVEAIPSLTPLRGIAALLVVAFHLRFYIPNLQYEAVFPVFHFGYLWVDFFFVLSGFILTHVYGHQLEGGLGPFRYRSFLYARWSRIYPLHFAVLFAFVAFELIQLGLSSGFGLLPGFRAFSGTHTIAGIFSHLFLVNTLNLHDQLLWNYPAWSISAELVAYIAFPVLFLAGRRMSPLLAGFVFSLLLFLLNLLALSNGGRLAIHHDYGAVRCLLEFSMGVLTYRAYHSERFRGLLQSDAGFALVVGWILIGMVTYSRDILIVTAFPALVLFAAMNTGRVARALRGRVLTHLGDISYSIYMVNILLFQIAHVVWRLFRGDAFGSGFGLLEAWIAWFAAMGLVVAIATCSHRWIERPARDYLRSRDLFGVGARPRTARDLGAEAELARS